ncbi:alpha,alpha-trehalase ath1 [Pseudogymnoascus australis]
MFRSLVATLAVLSCQLSPTRAAAAIAEQKDFSITNTNVSAVWNQTEWSLTTVDYVPAQYQSRMSLSNGYVGASLAAAGPFFEYDMNQTNPDGDEPANVWPLFSRRLSFSTISGFYNVQQNGSGTNYPWLEQYGYESFIAGIPHATGIIFTFGDASLDSTADPSEISNFESSLTFKTGVASWAYKWSPAGVSTTFQVSFKAIFSRVTPNLVAVEAQITPSGDVNGKVTDVLDGRSAVRSYLADKKLDEKSTTILTSVHPDNLPNVTAYLVSTAEFDDKYTNKKSRVEASAPIVSANETTIGQTFDIALKSGQTATFYKYVGVASTDKFEDAEAVARKASKDGSAAGWSAAVSEHVAAWGELMTEAAIDNFTDPTTGQLPPDPEIEILQIATVANSFYLLQSLQPDGSGLNDNSISVGGLASESYAGMIFWDADYWMAPGINLNFPSYSKQISNFRIKQFDQAKANAAFNNYPNESVLYPWTAGRYGNCTGTGPCVDYEYHLNHDIAFNLVQTYNITQNKTWFDNGPRQIVESIAHMTGELLDYNETTKTYWIHNMTDPDEYANHIDNGAFTIASSADLLLVVNELRRNNGEAINETWQHMSENIEFPTAPSDITLEFQTMDNNVNVKQADVILLAYPLDYDQNNYTAADKLLDLDYYSNRQSPNGPAMTYSISAIVANAISPSGCAAYTFTLNGFLPYLRAPFYQFSEQNDDNVVRNGHQNPAFPFLTGHGGSNQIAPFGFLGLRTDRPHLFINPSLPPQIPHLKLRDIYFAGAGLRVSMNRTHTTITRFSTEDIATMTDKYAGTSMPIDVGTTGDNKDIFNIDVDQTIYVPNRLYFDNITYTGNLLQCKKVSSIDAYAPGQFPQAAIDGAIATAWQPMANGSASILIDLSSGSFEKVSQLYFNWGARPPRRATVSFGNETASDCNGERQLSGKVVRIPLNSIKPNDPYDAAEAAAAVVKPYIGNETLISVPGDAWSGTWAKLEIEGCWANTDEDQKGATVAEFVVVGGGADRI